MFHLFGGYKDSIKKKKPTPKRTEVSISYCQTQIKQTKKPTEFISSIIVIIFSVYKNTAGIA